MKAVEIAAAPPLLAVLVLLLGPLDPLFRKPKLDVSLEPPNPVLGAE
jgi:hypothetical protein